MYSEGSETIGGLAVRAICSVGRRSRKLERVEIRLAWRMTTVQAARILYHE